MRIVSQVLALIVLTSSIAAASGSTASWSPAVVSKVEVGQVGKSSFTITAWVDLPTQVPATLRGSTIKHRSIRSRRAISFRKTSP